MVDPAKHNREFWDREVEKGNAWTRWPRLDAKSPPKRPFPSLFL